MRHQSRGGAHAKDYLLCPCTFNGRDGGLVGLVARRRKEAFKSAVSGSDRSVWPNEKAATPQACLTTTSATATCCSMCPSASTASKSGQESHHGGGDSGPTATLGARREAALVCLAAARDWALSDFCSRPRAPCLHSAKSTAACPFLSESNPSRAFVGLPYPAMDSMRCSESPTIFLRTTV
jgi:hypothetical protein